MTISRLDGATRAKVESYRIGLGESPVASVNLPSLFETNAIVRCVCRIAAVFQSRASEIARSRGHPICRELPWSFGDIHCWRGWRA